MGIYLSEGGAGRYGRSTTLLRGRVYDFEQHLNPDGSIRRTWVDGKPLWQFWLRHPIRGYHIYRVTRNLLMAYWARAQ